MDIATVSIQFYGHILVSDEILEDILWRMQMPQTAIRLNQYNYTASDLSSVVVVSIALVYKSLPTLHINLKLLVKISNLYL